MFFTRMHDNSRNAELALVALRKGVSSRARGIEKEGTETIDAWELPAIVPVRVSSCPRDLAPPDSDLNEPDRLQGLKLKAKDERRNEMHGQRHWFSIVKKTVCLVKPAPDNKYPGKNSESIPAVDRQSRLEAILDLLTLGTTHHSSKR